MATFFLARSSAAKALIDLLHLRINKNIETQHAEALKVADLQGYNKGIEVGRNQMMQEITVVQVVANAKAEKKDGD